MRRILTVLVLCLCVSGCVSEKGEPMSAGERYFHPSGYFACDVPGNRQGFSSNGRVERSGAWVTFRDVTNPEMKLEIVGAPLHSIYQKEYGEKGVFAGGVWRAEFERGHVFLIAERAVVLSNGHPARLGVLQTPYWPEDASYMGAFLAESYRTSESTPPAVFTIANLVIGETHYTAYYFVPARMFLSPEIPLRDVEQVKEGLLRRKDRVAAVVTDAMTAWLSTCALTGFAKAQIPYEPPVR